MSNSPIIRAVIFDMDGVLADSEPLINEAAIAMFAERGLSVQPDDFLPFVGAGEDRYIGGVAEKYNFPLDLPAAKQRTYEIYLDLVPMKLQAFPGVLDLIRACRAAGLRLAVASSADAIKVRANLQKIGLPPETWDVALTREHVQRNKPAPDIFLLAAQKLGVEPIACVVVEDAVNGVRAAKAAGMRCVAVAHTFAAEQLQEADLVREKIAQVQIVDLAPNLMATPSGTVFETERLTLRQFLLDDAAFILELVNDPDWLRFIGDRNVRTLADARNYLQNGPLAMYARSGFGLYAVVLKSNAAPIGMCGLIKREGLDDVDVGFAFLPRYRAQGYAYEAAAATLAFGRHEFGLQRIAAITSQDNERSIQLLQKLGFTFERLIQLPNDDEELKLFAVAA